MFNIFADEIYVSIISPLNAANEFEINLCQHKNNTFKIHQSYNATKRKSEENNKLYEDE